MPAPNWLKRFEDKYLFDEMRRTDELLNLGRVKCVIGGFFEVLAAMILDGEHAEEPVTANWSVYPDVILWGDKDRLVEVKGVNISDGAIIDIEQVLKYEEIVKNDFPFTNGEVYYMLFVHGLSRSRLKMSIEKKYVSIDNLITGLSGNVLCCIYVPVEIIKKFMEWISWLEYGSWIRASRGYIRLSSYQMYKHIMRDDLDGWFRKMAEVEELTWETNGWKMETHIIHNVNICGNTVKDFPLVVVDYE